MTDTIEVEHGDPSLNGLNPQLPTLDALVIEPATIHVGTPEPRGTVRLSGPAPADGVMIQLRSTPAEVVRVPPEMAVPGGAAQVEFPVWVNPAAGATNAEVSARWQNAARFTTLSIDLPETPHPPVSPVPPVAPVTVDVTTDDDAASRAPQAQAVAVSMEARVDAIRKSMAGANLDDAGQLELSRLARALDDIIAQRLYRLVGDIELAVTLLTGAKSQLVAAAGVRKNVEHTLGRFGLITFLRRNSPTSNVVLGLVSLILTFGVVVGWLILPRVHPGDTVAGMDASMLVLVAFSGALGSIVSIMYRLGDLKDSDVSDAIVPYFTGLFKPIIGIGFALFVFAVLAAQLLSVVNPAPGKEAYFFAALAFVTGFAEKLAPDIIKKVDAAVDSSEIRVPGKVS